jgi:hypothetical protein
MDSVEIIFIGILGIVAVFLFAMLGAVIGAFCGWIVGFTPLGTYILAFLSSANIHTNMVDLGAFVGFTGAFFHSHSNK